MGLLVSLSSLMHSIKITTLLIQQTINEWIFQVVKSIYDNLQSEVRINNTTLSQWKYQFVFSRICVEPNYIYHHHGSLGRVGCLWDLLCAYDLACQMFLVTVLVRFRSKVSLVWKLKQMGTKAMCHCHRNAELC